MQLQGMSDASLKEDQCPHAWILTTGAPEHITDPKICTSKDQAQLMDMRLTYHLQGVSYRAKRPWLISKLLLDAHNTTYIRTKTVLKHFSEQIMSSLITKH